MTLRIRHKTVCVLALALTLTWGDTVRAEPTASESQFRNPIEWLLSDIGKLLKTATTSLAPTGRADRADTAEADAAKAPEPAEKTAEAEPPVSKPVAVAAAEPDAPAKPRESGFRNPLSWLLSDLARIFQPELEIEQRPAEQKEPSAPIIDIAAAETAHEPAPPQSPQGTPEADASTAVTEPAATSKGFKNPIAWLFNDLAGLIKPKTDNIAEAADGADVKTGPEHIVAEAAHSLAPATAPIEIEPAVAAPEHATERSSEPAPAAEPVPADIPVTIGPWVPRPESDLFNPSDSLFSTTGEPLLALNTVPQPAPVAIEVATADPQPKAAVIRERAPHRPLQRNHAAIGRDHKAVTPDPLDDSLLDRVLENIFGFGAPDAPEVTNEEPLANKISDRIVPEEKLDLGYTSPDARIPDQELTKIGDTPLNNIDLVMGRDSIIGMPYDAAAHSADSCIERALHGSVFCLKDLQWPAGIASSFATDTAFVLPGEGVVRYENGTVSRVYAIFKASDFADVVKYMQHHFGPPQEREIGWMHMLEAPKLPNTTFRWKAFNADHSEAIVLEVRNFDDLRRSFADMERGMVRLYRIGSRPIFKHISTMDLMLMQRRRLAGAPVEVNQPPKQQ